jgi:ribosomal protein S18 acetylase RimI-like enzyme
MQAICLHNKDEIEAFLRQDPFLHLYELGDLDDFFWHHTTWYALKDCESIQQLVLFYTGSPLPVLLALSRDPTERMEKLLRSILHLLPRQFYAHLSSNLVRVLMEDYQAQGHGLHYKMGLLHPESLNAVKTSDTFQLSPANIEELNALYRASYPGNWFEPRMLETGYYYGIRRNAALVGVAGVHVYSQRYKVAALGNITVHPNFRGQGLGTILCARLCQALLPTVETIGLNVKADNTSAICCYTKLGFEMIAAFKEYSLLFKPEMMRLKEV